MKSNDGCSHQYKPDIDEDSWGFEDINNINLIVNPKIKRTYESKQHET